MPVGKPLNIDWEAVKATYLTGPYSLEEVARLFNIKAVTVRSHAMKGKWREMKTNALAPVKQIHAQAVQNATAATENQPKSQENEPTYPKSGTNNAVSVRAEDRILAIRNKTDNFRERVSAQTIKCLEVLEQTEIETIGQVDAFASALDKIEKTGARARGYDKEVPAATNVLINLQVLRGEDVREIASEPVVQSSGTISSGDRLIKD